MIIRALSILGLVGLVSCVPVDCPTCTSTPPRPVAHVTNIDGGTAAFVGSAPAHVNQPIFAGDHFYTGAGTKMEIAIDNGGTVVLDANTDPNFFTTATCFVIRLFSGQMAVNSTPTNPVCVEKGPNVAGQHSYVVYQANANSLRITVLEGQVVTISPPGVVINAGQSAVLQDGRVASPPQQVPPPVLNRIRSWIPIRIL